MTGRVKGGVWEGCGEDEGQGMGGGLQEHVDGDGVILGGGEAKQKRQNVVIVRRWVVGRQKLAVWSKMTLVM